MVEKLTIELDPYQAANLLWFLKRIWYSNALPEPVKPVNSGDWEGEIPQLLEKAMKEAGGQFLTYKANGDRDPFTNPRWDEVAQTYRWDDEYAFRIPK